MTKKRKSTLKKRESVFTTIKSTKLDKTTAKILRAQGLDHVVFSEQSFDPYGAISEFKPKVENVKTKLFGAKIQSEILDSLFANPLKPRTICISSFPSDIRAKALAAKLMEAATQQYMASTVQQQKGRKFPMWHRVLGGYKDPVRDAEKIKPNPSMLIISNVNMESTPHKIEKVRDLIDMYPDIPRVVVTGGVNPVDFFQHKLFYPLDEMVFLGTSARVGGSNYLEL